MYKEITKHLQTTDLKSSVITWQGFSQKERIDASGYAEFSEDEQLFFMWLGLQLVSHAIMKEAPENHVVNKHPHY